MSDEKPPEVIVGPVGTAAKIVGAALAKQQKLAALKAKIAAADAALEDKKLDRDLVDFEIYANLQAQQGAANVKAVEIPSAPPLPGLVVFRAPGDDYKAYVALINKPSTSTAQKLAGQRDLVVSTALYPERSVLEQVLNAQAGLVQSLALEVMKFAGGLLEEKGKE